MSQCVLPHAQRIVIMVRVYACASMCVCVKFLIKDNHVDAAGGWSVEEDDAHAAFHVTVIIMMIMIMRVIMIMTMMTVRMMMRWC